jgi:hypothetical protein
MTRIKRENFFSFLFCLFIYLKLNFEIFVILICNMFMNIKSRRFFFSQLLKIVLPLWIHFIIFNTHTHKKTTQFLNQIKKTWLHIEFFSKYRYNIRKSTYKIYIAFIKITIIFKSFHFEYYLNIIIIIIFTITQFDLITIYEERE